MKQFTHLFTLNRLAYRCTVDYERGPENEHALNKYPDNHYVK